MLDHQAAYVDHLLAVVEACLSNVRHHVGREAPAWVLLEEVGDDVVVSVRDNGPGIPPGDVARAFEPFVRLEASRNRNTGGTGLGLTLAQTFVHQHGGTIEFESRPGHTCFTVLMPFGPDQ